MGERITKLAVVEVWQYGKVIFTGNSLEVKEHFNFSQKQFNRISMMGRTVQNGSKRFKTKSTNNACNKNRGRKSFSTLSSKR
ncbi:hypothetical protein [Lactococcus petauri]